MSKSVLLVEQSLAVRGIAESLLRQNGYNVIAVENGESAKQVLHDSKIDLLLIDSDIKDARNIPFIDFICDSQIYSKIPLLILHDSTSGIDLSFPPEVIINKPFTPRDFLSAISTFAGTRDQAAPDIPFEGGELDDDIIDAALGIDKIEVNGSEVIGNDTDISRIKKRKESTESLVGFESNSENTDSSIITKQVEKINVAPDDNSPKEVKKKESHPQKEIASESSADNKAEFLGSDSASVKSRSPQPLSESSKIEIVTDQFGITVPEGEIEPDSNSHDYNWFVNELKREAEGKPAVKPSGDPNNDGSSIQFSTPAEFLNPKVQAQPVDPPKSKIPEIKASPSTGKAKVDTNDNQEVEKFISEFKEEMKKISSENEPQIPVENISEQPLENKESAKTINWDENLDDLSEPQLKNLSKDLINSIANAVAIKIVDSLDEDTIYNLLKDSIREYLHNKH